MRIFIKNYNINKIADVIPLLNKYNTQLYELLEVYSTDGIYNIDSNNLVKLNYTDIPITSINNYYKDISILIDKSYINIEKVSQLPPEHIAISINKQSFFVNKTSPIKMILETINDNNNTLYNFYFEMKDELDINNVFIKEELIVFLSLLN